MATPKITINRTPVLTLWGTVVAERLGYDHDTALTLGKAVAGLNAQSKARRLGIVEALSAQRKGRKPSGQEPGKPLMITILGRPVPVMSAEHGVRATVKGQPIDPASVTRYLRQKFGPALAEVQSAMEALTQAYSPDTLAAQAYALYEQFRPDIPEGQKGWGAAGHLDLDAIRALAD